MFNIHLLDSIFTDNEVVNHIREDLKVRGFSFVKHNMVSYQQDAENFFNLTNKEDYFHPPIFGYFKVPHKEVFRFKTGSKLEEQNYPPLLSNIKDFSKTLDVDMTRLAERLFPGINKNEIPLGEWALFDIVRYNNKVSRKNNLNIVEHYDAGLLTFSFLSTEPGLQFCDEWKNWIDPPMNVGVLWTGNAIKLYDNAYQRGLHRVVQGDKPRLAMWYEICTYAQERNDLKENRFVGYDYELKLMENEGFLPERDGHGFIKGWRDLVSNNISVGNFVMEHLTTGTNKTAMGSHALTFKSSQDNIAIGVKMIF